MMSNPKNNYLLKETIKLQEPLTVIKKNIDKIILEKNSQATILLDLNDKRDLDIEVILGNGANLKLFVLSTDEKIASIKINLQLVKDAQLQLFNLLFTGQDIILEENINLTEAFSEANIYNIIVSNKNSHVNSKILLNHLIDNTKSNLDNYSIALDASVQTLDNNAHIYSGAQNSVVKQKAKSLILSKEAVIKAMPNLFIDEYDVIANHAASIGSFNEEDMFYLMSRGLTFIEATNIMIKGFISPIVDRIENSDVKKTVMTTFNYQMNI